MGITSPSAFPLDLRLSPPTRNAAKNFYLKLDTIPGDSTARDHRGEIELLGFDWGVRSTPPSPAGGGGGASKPTPGEFSFLTRSGKASPLLLRAATTGRHLRSALLSVVTVGDRPLLQIEINLEDVLVTGFEIHTDAADARPLDLVGLSFAKITHSFHPQNDDGSLGEVVTTSWNFKTNGPT